MAGANRTGLRHGMNGGQMAFLDLQGTAEVGVAQRSPMRLLLAGAVVGAVLLVASVVVELTGAADPALPQLPVPSRPSVPQLPSGVPSLPPLPTGIPTNLPSLPPGLPSLPPGLPSLPPLPGGTR